MSSVPKPAVVTDVYPSALGSNMAGPLLPAGLTIIPGVCEKFLIGDNKHNTASVVKMSFMDNILRNKAMVSVYRIPDIF
jgi:hypothetical protein